jgi:hypothetical protein
MDSSKLSLSNLIGQQIYVKIPAWKPDKILTVSLIGVDVGGIWIESNEFMEEFVAGAPHKMTQNSVQIFVPYPQILAIYHVGGGPWISEKVAE